jgi:hypothetical protein
MTPGQITIRQFTADDTMTWRTIRLEALANAPIAFGQTLEDAEKQAIEDLSVDGIRTVSTVRRL